MSNLFENPHQATLARNYCLATRAYREFKADVERCHPNGIPDERQGIKDYLAKLEDKKDVAYLKWLEVEVSAYGK
jgi:hypothetical protein